MQLEENYLKARLIINYMFYKPISVREALQNINETWFLPAIQRPYDWGERNKKEHFIYKLFDSLLRRYPIGTLIIWQTKKPIPFRDFLKDYDTEKLEKIKDRGLWSDPNKHLVYDGQQRLQSLYSCLKYTFHNKVLCYDLLFNPEKNKDSQGFKFFKKNEKLEPKYLRLNELYSCNIHQQAEFEESVVNRFNADLNKEERLLVKKNLKNLWNVFVEGDIKLLAFYPLKVDLDEKEVVDIFRRINTTGMQLTKSEILFSEIKRIQFDFEENIWNSCHKIKKGTGYSISPDEVLKILFLLIKEGIRVDPERIGEEELKEFVKIWKKLESPLMSFFSDFIYKEFKINHEKIINLKRPLIPLIAYFYYMRAIKGYKYKDFTSRSIENMKKYFVISQLNYWEMDSYVDNFHRKIKEIITQGTSRRKGSLDFPFEKLKNFVKKGDKRECGISSSNFDNKYLRWFILKILIPDREYHYIKDPDERFNPEIDHIFPLNPSSEKKYPKKYYKWANTIWNLQPIKGEINAIKLNTPPQEFFIKYHKYLKDYNFLPNTNLKDVIWSDKNAKKFIQRRKSKMLKFVKDEYGITVS